MLDVLLLRRSEKTIQNDQIFFSKLKSRSGLLTPEKRDRHFFLPNSSIISIFALMIRDFFIYFLLSVTTVVSAQTDNALKQKTIRQWQLSADCSEEVSIPFDTTFSLFHRYRISDRYSPMNATLGNYGLPFYQLNFFDRITDHDKFIYAGYYPLMHLPDMAVFMNTQVPFTELVWSYGGPRETSEQTFRVRHSQNVNRYLNFGLIYDIVYNLGQYNYQRAEDKTFTFFTSYTGLKYNLYFSAGLNNMTSYENGGIAGTDQLSLFDTRSIPVKLGSLNKAISILKNRNILLVQKYVIGKQQNKPDTEGKANQGFTGLSGIVSHIFSFETNTRTYSDAYPGSGFYDTILISNTETFDSLRSQTIKNTIRFDFTTDTSRKFQFGGGIGFRNEIYSYGQIIPTYGNPVADTARWHKNNNVVVGKLFNNIGEKFGWTVNGELFLSGYRAGDFVIIGTITKGFSLDKGYALWIINGGMRNMQPSFWYEQWGSNHFEWHNNMKKEFRIDIGTSFSYPARKATLKFNYAIIDNYTDFDLSVFPSQFASGLSVAAVSANKEINAWKFHLNTDLLVQKSSNDEVLDLPFVSIRSALYFEHLIRFRKTNGKLNTQIGADVSFHSAYSPYSYMPATGRFFRQDAVKTGDYPFINVFLNLKLKRTRIFLMLDHLNAGYMGYDYFMVPDYPMNVRMFRYGLAWTFYN